MRGRSSAAQVTRRVRALIADPPGSNESGWTPDSSLEALLPGRGVGDQGGVPGQVPGRVPVATSGRPDPPESVPRTRLEWLLDTRVRAAPSRAAVVAVAATVVLVGGFSVAWLLASRPRALPLAPRIAAASSSIGAAPVAGAAKKLVVDVTGKVRRPGVYELDAGARVTDALKAAGGALPGTPLASLNLARKLVDGEQIAVGQAVANPAGGGAASAGSVTGGSVSAGAAPGLVNLNTATPAELDALPGVGPVLAANIVAWRTEHGQFGSADQLREVTGIGPSKFAQLKALVTV